MPYRVQNQPPAEYLRILDEIIHCRNDKRLNLLKDKFKQVINREPSGFSEITPLIERYRRSVVSFHIHGSFPHRARNKTGLIRSRANFCATIQSRKASTAQPTGVSNTLKLHDAGSNKIQVSVLVDVRKMAKKSESIIRGSHTVVRLQGLDDCKRAIGNPRKFTGEVRLLRSTFRFSGSQGKADVFLPFGVKRGNSRILLDEFESEIIQGGTHLINHLARQNGNLSRRRLRNVQFLFALRLSDDFVRLSSGVRGDYSLDGAKVFRCSDELDSGRLLPISGHGRL